MAEGEAGVSVVGLNIFPVKSCKAVKVQEIEVDSYGVVGDRRFMVVEQGGRFVSQRKCPKLVTVTATYVRTGETEFLQLCSPEMETALKILPKYDGERMHSSVWESQVDVLDQGDEAADWLSKLLESPTRSYRLVASAESAPDRGYRRLIANFPPSLQDKLPPMEVALADSAPVSLVSHESLAALNEKLSEHTGNTVTLSRFRMNIEVAGCSKAYEEDEWLLIKIGSAPFLVYTAAERCKMTCIDQDTGKQDKMGPLDILRIYRAPKGPTHSIFGQLLVPLQSGARVRVGDRVEVLERKKYV
ncbi:hypothetical protein EMCRGX_G030976 [Ephydatia muelleri]|eukprot:Em0018g1047a